MLGLSTENKYHNKLALNTISSYYLKISINYFYCCQSFTCDWLALKVDKVFDADVVDIEDGDGDVQLISVSLTLSPDTEDNELLLTPCVSWLPALDEVGGIKDNGRKFCWPYDDEEDLALRLNAASSEKWGSVLLLPLSVIEVLEDKSPEYWVVPFWQPLMFKFST